MKKEDIALDEWKYLMAKKRMLDIEKAKKENVIEDNVCVTNLEESLLLGDSNIEREELI
jgi:hypothetical protein